jgi:hydroxymethyl cephem carbamoyltransferase
VIAWVQGWWEIAPRALGHQALLAESFRESTKVRLNDIKQRQSYRLIAPCCRVEDADTVFPGGFEDPYMLYFRKVRSDAVRGFLAASRAPPTRERLLTDSRLNEP